MYLVYVLYENTLEQSYLFSTLESAQHKLVELATKWTNQDQLTTFSQQIGKPIFTFDHNDFAEYYQVNEDDGYVGVTQPTKELQ